MRRQGFSIGQIAARLNVSESTAHWHVSDMRLTEKQRRDLREQWRRRMAEVNGRRRGKALKHIAFQRPRWSGALVHLVAHLSFDGRVDRYGCHYYSRSKKQVLHVRDLFSSLIGTVPTVRLRPNGIWTASCYHVEIAHWFAGREVELVTAVADRPMWRQIWLKALFDDEGHIHVIRGHRRIRASQKDPSVLQAARGFLQQMSIESRMDYRAQALEITGRDNLELFRKLVNFSSGIRINGHRKNGLHHHDIEKRVLLDRALASYRTA